MCDDTEYEAGERLRPARGIAIGLALCLVFWFVVVVAVRDLAP